MSSEPGFDFVQSNASTPTIPTRRPVRTTPSPKIPEVSSVPPREEPSIEAPISEVTEANPIVPNIPTTRPQKSPAVLKRDQLSSVPFEFENETNLVDSLEQKEIEPIVQPPARPLSRPGKKVEESSIPSLSSSNSSDPSEEVTETLPPTLPSTRPTRPPSTGPVSSPALPSHRPSRQSSTVDSETNTHVSLPSDHHSASPDIIGSLPTRPTRPLSTTPETEDSLPTIPSARPSLSQSAKLEQSSSSTLEKEEIVPAIPSTRPSRSLSPTRKQSVASSSEFTECQVAVESDNTPAIPSARPVKSSSASREMETNSHLIPSSRPARKQATPNESEANIPSHSASAISQETPIESEANIPSPSTNTLSQETPIAVNEESIGNTIRNVAEAASPTGISAREQDEVNPVIAAIETTPVLPGKNSIPPRPIHRPVRPSPTSAVREDSPIAAIDAVPTIGGKTEAVPDEAQEAGEKLETPSEKTGETFENAGKEISEKKKEVADPEIETLEKTAEFSVKPSDNEEGHPSFSTARPTEPSKEPTPEKTADLSAKPGDNEEGHPIVSTVGPSEPSNEVAPASEAEPPLPVVTGENIVKSDESTESKPSEQVKEIVTKPDVVSPAPVRPIVPARPSKRPPPPVKRPSVESTGHGPGSSDAAHSKPAVPRRPQKLSPGGIAAAFETENRKPPAPPTKPKPPAKLGKVGALRASLFKDLDNVISRGGVPMPMGFPKPPSATSPEKELSERDAGAAEKAEEEGPAPSEKKLTDVRRGRAKGPRGRKLPAAAKSAYSTIVTDVWSVGPENLAVAEPYKEDKPALKDDIVEKDEVSVPSTAPVDKADLEIVELAPRDSGHGTEVKQDAGSDTIIEPAAVTPKKEKEDDIETESSDAGLKSVAGELESKLESFVSSVKEAVIPSMKSEKPESADKEVIEPEIDSVKIEPDDAEPIKIEPEEIKPVETEPVEVAPVEAAPVETKSAETEPVEIAPVEVDCEQPVKNVTTSSETHDVTSPTLDISKAATAEKSSMFGLTTSGEPRDSLETKSPSLAKIKDAPINAESSALPVSKTTEAFDENIEPVTVAATTSIRKNGANESNAAVDVVDDDDDDDDVIVTKVTKQQDDDGTISLA